MQSGKPHIDPEALIQLINMIRITRVYSVFPEWSVLSTDRNEVTRHFMDGDTDLEINWYSSIPDSNIDQYSYRPVPGLTEKSASTLTGWYWSVANPAPERQAASKQLLTFLYQPIFASTWSDTAGYLPVTSQHWPQTDVTVSEPSIHLELCRAAPGPIDHDHPRPGHQRCCHPCIFDQ